MNKSSGLKSTRREGEEARNEVGSTTLHILFDYMYDDITHIN